MDNNLTWHASSITKAQRAKLKNKNLVCCGLRD